MMFWKKKQEEKNASPETSAAHPKAGKQKQLSPKAQLAQKIEQLKDGEEMAFRLSETFGGWLSTVVCNPEHSKNSKRFLIYTETFVDDKPSGKRHLLWSSNQPKDIAEWMLNRDGHPFDRSSVPS